MIIENIELLKASDKVTRICDNCGKKDYAKIANIIISRKNRLNNKLIKNNEIDLCKHCSSIGKYRAMPRGKNSKLWKHGISVHGYREVYDESRRDIILEHRYVIEKNIGRRLNEDEHVHHINLDKLNCDISNLFVCDKRSHQLIHSSLQFCGYILFKIGAITFDSEKKEYSKIIYPFKQQIFLTIESIKRIGSYTYFYSSRHNKKYEFGVIKYNKKETNKGKHVIIAEEYLKRKLKSDECVHHLDGNGINNDLSNLFIMTKTQHGLVHTSIEKVAASFLGIEIIFNRGTGKYEMVNDII